MKRDAFFKAFTAEVCSNLFNDWSDNYDESCYGPEPKERVLSNEGSLKRRLRSWLDQPGHQNGAEVVAIFRTAFDFIASYLERLEHLYAQLADNESQSLLVKLMAFRALGHRKVKLPFNTPENRQGVVRYEAVSSTSDCIEAGFSGWKLRRIDLTTLGVPISLYSLPWTTFLQFGVQQYRCDCAPHAIEPVAGDYVLDGGAGWGDTALHFASKVGQGGHVISVEFTPTNLAIMRKNFELNPSLKPRIEIVENALWDKSGNTMSYSENGPATRLGGNNPGTTDTSVVSVTIDDLVKTKKLPRIDFIKMDVEGAELAALKGAEHTLRRFKPKLAICVYHRLEDFFDIPDYLASLQLGYRFFLRHFTIHIDETVLFATVN